jgi:hypothetical protein
VFIYTHTCNETNLKLEGDSPEVKFETTTFLLQVVVEFNYFYFDIVFNDVGTN